MENNIYIEFGKRLSELRTLKGVSQNHISKILGVAQTTYSGYENGARKVPLEVISALAKILDVSPTFLINGKSPKTSNSFPPAFSDKESNIIACFRQLNEDGQAYIEKQMDFALSQLEYKKLDELGNLSLKDA